MKKGMGQKTLPNTFGMETKMAKDPAFVHP
jgi:hypothetical protein